MINRLKNKKNPLVPLILILTYSLATSSPLSALHTIQQFSDINGLGDLTRAFFQFPEYSEQGEPGQATALTKAAFDQAVETFKEMLDRDVTFNNPDTWVNNTTIDNRSIEHATYEYRDNKYRLTKLYESGATVRYIQKLSLPNNSIVCFMGDSHGSIHSLIRNLWRLIALGYLNEDLSIRHHNFYMVFLGDYVDRGRWGAEVITTLLKLKTKNWNHIHLVAGNHETMGICIRDGFFAEVMNKFNNITSFKDIYTKVFMNLPVALFIESNGSKLQCCHGGIHEGFNPGAEAHLLSYSNKQYENVGNEDNCAGLFWSDFCGGCITGVNESRGIGIRASKDTTQTYLKNNSINAIMRAHQDMEFGLKVFMNSSKPCDDTLTTEGYSAMPHPETGELAPYALYNEDCLYHWSDVAARLGLQTNHFPLSTFDYYPSFTFTSAVEPRGFPYDCFGLVTTAHTWDQWNMSVYEAYLGRSKPDANRMDTVSPRHEMYVYVDADINDEDYKQTELVLPVGKQDDLITVFWSREYQPDYLNAALERIIQRAQSLPLIRPLSASRKQQTSNTQITHTLTTLQINLRKLKTNLTTLQSRLNALRNIITY